VVNVVGLDIGGANTKATFLKTKDGMLKEFRTSMEYFPIWKKGKAQLPRVLENLEKFLVDIPLDGVGVTLTAELSDAYTTKKEGVIQVLDCVTEVFDDVPIFVLDVEANLLSVKDAISKPLNVASANWAATGWMMSQLIENCIIVDVGSTTTSIIPVIDGKLAIKGRTDLEKLQNGELVYSGSLRTNIAAIVDTIPVRGKITRVSSELFAQSGDVHLILGNIEKKQYTAETCDGRGKTDREAIARLARVVCADISMLTEQEIRDMAKYVYRKQVQQISRGLKQVYERIKVSSQNLVVVVAGLGRKFLAIEAAEKAGFRDILDIEEYLGSEAAVTSPSAGVAILVATRLEGQSLKWKRF
jgi:probable H4MPT-linked C1 transfer pathway protein